MSGPIDMSQFPDGLHAGNLPPDFVEKLKVLVPYLERTIDLQLCFDDEAVKMVFTAASINIPIGSSEVVFPDSDGFTYWIVNRTKYPNPSDNGFSFARWNTLKFGQLIKTFDCKQITALMGVLCIIAGGNTQTIEQMTIDTLRFTLPSDN